MNLAAESKEKNMSLVKIQAWFFPLMILLIGISNVIVVYIGGNQYMKGEIELGVLAEFIIYVNMLTWPVATVGWITSIVQQAEASQKRINEFLKTKSSIINVSNKKMIIDGKINFNKVSLTFKETGIKALNDITFSIKRGESIALMGNVGSGKSTLLELICRVYDPNYGEILLDENNIKKMNINELRDCIGYVPQSTFLFSDSIINNIKFGKLDASMEEVEESAETACLTKDIKSFKDKYETLLGERGVNLSGGQKQRLAIARAIIKKPKILILDDSLSAVDTETEEKILSGLSNVTKNMTVIIATHRVSSAKNCDKILILENGSIIEFGSHEDLINNNGYYSTSYQKQSS
jgi:ATP-binding cassette subfamily B protein